MDPGTKALLVLQRLLEHGSWYMGAIELGGRLDGEELGDEAEAIVREAWMLNFMNIREHWPEFKVKQRQA